MVGAMVTLTGFDDSEKTADEWRAYIERLELARANVLADYEAWRRQGRVSGQELLRFLSREDVLLEHISRAKWELERQTPLGDFMERELRGRRSLEGP